MSEMLANQYFMACRYECALPLLEDLVADAPHAVPLRNKLLVCYLQTNRIDEAIDLCLEILRSDPASLVGIDPYGEHFPCLELSTRRFPPRTVPEFNRVALLNLYCRPRIACFHLTCSLELSGDQPRIRTILDMLYRYLASFA